MGALLTLEAVVGGAIGAIGIAQLAPQLLEGARGEKGDPGDKGDDGPEGPRGKDGVPGDTGVKGADGPAGQNGSIGQDGTDGQDATHNFFFNPTTVPDDSEGVDGDVFLKTDTGELYRKSAGAWPVTADDNILPTTFQHRVTTVGLLDTMLTLNTGASALDASGGATTSDGGWFTHRTLTQQVASSNPTSITISPQALSGATTATLSTGVATDDYYVGWAFVNNATNHRITAYVGGTKVATFTPALTATITDSSAVNFHSRQYTGWIARTEGASEYLEPVFASRMVAGLGMTSASGAISTRRPDLRFAAFTTRNDSNTAVLSHDPVAGTLTLTGTLAVTSSSTSNAFAVGRQGFTNPAFRVVNTGATDTSGIEIKSTSPSGAGDGPVISAIGGAGADLDLVINAKGTGGIRLARDVSGLVIVGSNLGEGVQTQGKLHLCCGAGAGLLKFEAATSTNSLVVQNDNMASTRTYNIPDVAADCRFQMGIRKVRAVTTTPDPVLAISDSASLITLNPAASTYEIVLPTPTVAGIWFEFVLLNGPAGGNIDIVAADGVIGYYINGTTNTDVVGTTQRITFTSAGLAIGDRLRIMSFRGTDSPRWVVEGRIAGPTPLTLANS